MIELETDTLSAVENASNVRLCASIVNPDLMNFSQMVQLQVFTQNSTAQGMIMSMLSVIDSYLNDLMQNLRTTFQYRKA